MDGSAERSTELTPKAELVSVLFIRGSLILNQEETKNAHRIFPAGAVHKPNQPNSTNPSNPSNPSNPFNSFSLQVPVPGGRSREAAWWLVRGLKSIEIVLESQYFPKYYYNYSPKLNSSHERVLYLTIYQ